MKQHGEAKQGMDCLLAVLPGDIERRSFEIIGEELTRQGICLDDTQSPVIKRVIHTTADFDYVNTLCFSSRSPSFF